MWRKFGGGKKLAVHRQATSKQNQSINNPNPKRSQP
jgi:hypothetical protein